MVKTQTGAKSAIISIERIAASIYLIRGQKMLIDSDLALLYGVETRVLVQAVKRNIARFPEDFMFQLSQEELESWRSQIVISNPGAKKGLRHAPYAFTEHGVAMLSSVLRSQRAVEVNIAIIRTFIKLRQILATNEELARMVAKHDRQIAVLFENVQRMLAPAPLKKNSIGFVPSKRLNLTRSSLALVSPELTFSGLSFTIDGKTAPLVQNDFTPISPGDALETAPRRDPDTQYMADDSVARLK